VTFTCGVLPGEGGGVPHDFVSAAGTTARELDGAGLDGGTLELDGGSLLDGGAVGGVVGVVVGRQTISNSTGRRPTGGREIRAAVAVEARVELAGLPRRLTVPDERRLVARTRLDVERDRTGQARRCHRCAGAVTTGREFECLSGCDLRRG
jgi:hypothetical protein